MPQINKIVQILHQRFCSIILDHIYSLEVVGVQGLLTSQPLWNRNADAKFGLFYLSVAFLFIWNLQLNSEFVAPESSAH
jgi:hypothetical protein